MYWEYFTKASFLSESASLFLCLKYEKKFDLEQVWYEYIFFVETCGKC